MRTRVALALAIAGVVSGCSEPSASNLNKDMTELDLSSSSEMSSDVEMGSIPDLSREDMARDQPADMFAAGDMPADMDMDTSPPVMLPFAQTLTLTQGASSAALEAPPLTAVAPGDGVLLFALKWDAAIEPELRSFTVSACDEQDRCQDLRAQTQDKPSWASHLYIWESAGAANRVRLKLSARSSAMVTTLNADVTLRFLPWQDRLSASSTLANIERLNVPVAFRGIVPANPTPRNPSTYTAHWFDWVAPARGFAQLIDVSTGGANTSQCQEDVIETPWACGGLDRGPKGLELKRAGRQLFLVKNRYSEAQYKVVLSYEQEPNAPRCQINEHDDGAGRCVAQGSCAQGFHDGGWGECVAAGSCEPLFKLDAQGDCRGWRYASHAPDDLQIERSWYSTNELIKLSDGRYFYTNNLPKTDTLPARRRPAIFDPRSASWSLSATEEPASSSVYRSCPLADGRVLTVGYGGILDNSAKPEQIYDPVADAWSDLPTLSGIVWSNSVNCTLLQNGRTLVSRGGVSLAFNPLNNTWESAIAYPGEYRSKGVVELPGGELVTVVTSAGNNPTTVLMLEPNATMWRDLGPWSVPNQTLYEYTQLIPCGARAFCAWGASATTFVGARYDLNTQLWSVLQPPPANVNGQLISDPQGGYLVSSLYQQGTFSRYSPDTDQWSMETLVEAQCMSVTFDPSSSELLCINELVTRYRR